MPKPFSSVSLAVPETAKKGNQLPAPRANPATVPMNKVQVGYAPSPNLMKVQSRIGSLSNTDHKVTNTFWASHKIKEDFPFCYPNLTL